MKHSDEGSLVILTSVASLTNATNYASFDTKGFDQANIYTILGTGNTQTAVVTGLKISEHDTTTSASSMTDIAALCCSNTTSTSAVNSLPAAATQGKGGIVTEFQIDLRKRKRYVGLTITSDTVQTAVLSAVARLTRSAESSDTAAEKSLPINLGATSAVGCMQVVNG